jgi:hypothetical protein
MRDQVLYILYLLVIQYHTIIDHPPLLDYVYERNIHDPDIHTHLWKYRPAITLEHLTQQLEVGGLNSVHRVLSFFLREVPII